MCPTAVTASAISSTDFPLKRTKFRKVLNMIWKVQDLLQICQFGAQAAASDGIPVANCPE